MSISVSGCATDARFADIYTPVHPTSKDLAVISDRLVSDTLTNNVNYAKGNEGQFCDVYRVVHPTSNDAKVMSDQMVEPKLANNKMYERLKCK